MEVNNKTISSIRAHCNNINYIVKIFFYIFIFIALTSLIYTIFILAKYGDSLEVFSFNNEFLIRSSNFSFFSGGNISKSLVTSFSDSPYSNIKFAFLIIQFFWLIKRLVIILIFYLINKILNNIEKNYTPFLIENASKIKLVGLLLIAYSIVPNLITYPLLKLVTDGVSLDLDSSIPIIFAASFILLLSKIFTYGCELQKDSDETL